MKPSRLLIVLIIIFSLFTASAILIFSIIKPFLPFSEYLLGKNNPTSYLVLLGNDAEMRANGGFTGSYAKIVLHQNNNKSKNSFEFLIPMVPDSFLNTKIDVSFQDIYVPNGQLQGYVAPPEPIQQAFQHGSWQLANADWEPDFASSAADIRWFMEKGKETNPDNLILLNLTTIKKILTTVGSFQIPEYNAEITPDNLYLFLQGKAELNFFPGSTQKKDALTAVGSALVKKIITLSLSKKIEIFKILYLDLKNQNIVVNSTNSNFQAFLENNNFAGRLTSTTSDTYLLIETNLGANKANAFVTRQTDHLITSFGDTTTHKVTLRLTNSSLEENPNPPYHYGGNYIAYLRFYLPNNAQSIELASGSGTIKPNVSQNSGFTEIGFWNTTKAQNQSTIDLSYTLPLSKDQYSLTILKQHGLVTSPQKINLNGNIYTTDLTTDFLISPSEVKE